MKIYFRTPRLYISRGGFEFWVVPAADSHVDDREFWERVARKVGSAPSSLSYILPDVYREEEDANLYESMRDKMFQILWDSRIESLGHGYMLVERSLKSGVRYGILGALDLEYYSCKPGESAPVRATEPPSSRAASLKAARKRAILEFPHTMLFYKDKKNKLVKWLTEEVDLDRIYDFPLMEDGGNLRGFLIPEAVSTEVAAGLASRGEPCLAVADGHDELAAAKAHWEEVKASIKGKLSIKKHPARYALVECVNLYDPSVEIEPVHRWLCGIDSAAFIDYFMHNLRCRRDGNLLYPVSSGTEVVKKADALIATYLRADAGEVRYPKEKDLKRMPEDGVGVIFKEIGKEDLFSSLKGGTLLSPHTFCIRGEENKRYHFEGREISYD